MSKTSGRLGLHPVGDLHRLDRRLELRVARPLAVEPQPIQLLEQVQLAPLLGQRELLVVDVGHELLRVEVLADERRVVLLLHLVGDERALVHRRQEGAVPQRRAHRRRHVGTEHHEARQVLVVGAEAVGEPRAERWAADLGVAGVHHQHRRLVVRDVGVHGADEADVVGAAADVRKQLAHLHAALAVLLERERRLEQAPGLPFGRDVPAGQRLPVVLVEHRLGVEAVDLRQAAVHEQEDDVLRPGGVVERALRAGFAALLKPGGRERLADQAGERQHAEAVAHAAERVAPGDGTAAPV